MMELNFDNAKLGTVKKSEIMIGRGLNIMKHKTMVITNLIGFLGKYPDGTVTVINITNFDDIDKLILNGYEFTKTAENVKAV